MAKLLSIVALLMLFVLAASAFRLPGGLEGITRLAGTPCSRLIAVAAEWACMAGFG